MIHDTLTRRLGPRWGGLATAVCYAVMLWGVFHFWGRALVTMAYLH